MQGQHWPDEICAWAARSLQSLRWQQELGPGGHPVEEQVPAWRWHCHSFPKVRREAGPWLNTRGALRGQVTESSCQILAVKGLETCHRYRDWFGLLKKAAPPAVAGGESLDFASQVWKKTRMLKVWESQQELQRHWLCSCSG